MSKKTFLKGAAILGVAGLLVQVLGAFFRIPLANIIGDEGMGYYQTAYPIYVFLLVFSTNGAPAAISKMVSERLAVGEDGEAHRVFKLSFILMFVLGLLAFAVFFFGAGPIVELLGNPPAKYSMMAIAPALLVVPIMAVYRGYFQGMQEMQHTAVSQLSEQGVRVAVGLILAVVLVPTGLAYAAAGACLGTSIGPIVGCLVLILIYLKKRETIRQAIAGSKGELKETSGHILKTLVMITVPVTIGVSILPIMNMGDVMIVINKLTDMGLDGNTLYGQMSGLAGPIINIPQALALSMALALVPAIAAAKSSKDQEGIRQNVALGFRTAWIIGIPCTFGLMALSEPIMRLLYMAQADSASEAAPILFIMSIGIVFLAVALTMAGILQGLDRSRLAVYSVVIGFLVKVLLTYWLTGIPELNILGAAIASSAAYFVVGVCNFIMVKRLTGVKFDYVLSVGKPLTAGVVMTILVLLCYRVCAGFLGNTISTALSICVGGAAYGITLLKIGGIGASEIQALPKGDKLVKLLSKLHMI